MPAKDFSAGLKRVDYKVLIPIKEDFIYPSVCLVSTLIDVDQTKNKKAKYKCPDNTQYQCLGETRSILTR